MNILIYISIIVIITLYCIGNVNAFGRQNPGSKGKPDEDCQIIESKVVSHYNSGKCFWVGKQHSESINISSTGEALGPPLPCNFEIVTPITGSYQVQLGDKIIESSARYDISIKIAKKGTLTFFAYGIVTKGFWENATLALVHHYPNEEPELCSTKSGVTRSYSVYKELTFQKNCGERIVCFGQGLFEFYPGLSDKKSSISE